MNDSFDGCTAMLKPMPDVEAVRLVAREMGDAGRRKLLGQRIHAGGFLSLGRGMLARAYLTCLRKRTGKTGSLTAFSLRDISLSGKRRYAVRDESVLCGRWWVIVVCSLPYLPLVDHRYPCRMHNIDLYFII